MNIKTRTIINSIAHTGKEIAEISGYINAMINSEEFNSFTNEQKKHIINSHAHLRSASLHLHDFFCVYDEPEEIAATVSEPKEVGK